MKVGIIIPTCSPDDMENKFIPSLKYISELKGVAEFLIHFNGDEYSGAIIDTIVNMLHYLGWEYKYTFTKFPRKPVNLIRLRTECAILSPDCKYYMFADDDFRFVGSTPKIDRSSGQRYLEVIDYMDYFDECGVVNVKSFLGGKPQWLKIVPTDHEMIATNRGLFLRNMSDHGFLLSPKNTHHFVGGLEETLFAYERIALGYFVAKQMNNPTVHLPGKVSEDADEIHNSRIMDENIAGYIRERWGEWEYHSRNFPKKLVQDYNRNNGPKLTDRMIVDYE